MESQGGTIQYYYKLLKSYCLSRTFLNIIDVSYVTQGPRGCNHNFEPVYEIPNVTILMTMAEQYFPVVLGITY